MEAPSPVQGTGNDVLRYLAVRKAAADYGLRADEIDAVAGRFDARRVRPERLADALADLILARTQVPGAPG